MSDQSFITQIQDAEEKAEKKIAQAKAKQGDDLLAYEKKLSADRAKKLETAREKSRTKLKDQQQKAKSLYQEQVKDTEKEIQSVEKNAKERIPSAVSMAEAFLLDLLGVKK